MLENAVSVAEKYALSMSSIISAIICMPTLIKVKIHTPKVVKDGGKAPPGGGWSKKHAKKARKAASTIKAPAHPHASDHDIRLSTDKVQARRPQNSPLHIL